MRKYQNKLFRKKLELSRNNIPFSEDLYLYCIILSHNKMLFFSKQKKSKSICIEMLKELRRTTRGSISKNHT